MAKKVSFSRENFSLDSILDHHIDLQNSLRDYYINSLKNNILNVKFVGYTEVELFEEYKIRTDELEKSTIFSMLSALEASFRIDYLERSYGKYRDLLSRGLREIYKKKGNKASLEKDILMAWKAHCPDEKFLISELVSAFRFRHWLAHGRYWTPKLGRKYDYSYIHDLSFQIYQNFSMKGDYDFPSFTGN